VQEITVSAEGQEAGTSTADTNVVGILTLTGTNIDRSRSVQWDDTVVDNEGMGKKKSKSTHVLPYSINIGIAIDARFVLECCSLLHISKSPIVE
jgi:hypothetical protein